MRVSLGFEPAWFHRRCGVDFSERWHRDPYYRYETLKIMKEELVRSFPAATCWSGNNHDDLATISGCYGSYVVYQVFGMPVQYGKDRWPDMVQGKKLSLAQIEQLDVDSLLKGSFVQELFSQMDMIESEWGKIHGYLNWQGIFNTAFQLRGQDIFLDLYDKPDHVHDFFAMICKVMIDLAKKVHERQRRSGFFINQLSVSNCTVNMISSQQYREFVFPYDRKIALNFERFGVHTCNWDITHYIDILKELPNLGYLDMGMQSDLSNIKRLFPHTRLAVIYSPVILYSESIERIKEDLGRIYREVAPCDVVMADIRWDTPDKKVNQFLDICKQFELNRT